MQFTRHLFRREGADSQQLLALPPLRAGVESEPADRCFATPLGTLVHFLEIRVTILLVSLGILGFGAAALLLARASVPPRTVTQVLHDTEQAGRAGVK